MIIKKKGSWDVSDPDSDYEIWVPTTFSGNKCLFGYK